MWAPESILSEEGESVELGNGDFFQFLNTGFKVFVKTLDVAVEEGKPVDQPFPQHCYFLIV